ncbi:zinc finger protein 414 [Mugil cephalus]|uniref:zinc finger protein 414 n=1 Tax=Mugil cephalus TaxID=48193 RepID=UPI001FB7DE31|nr:zinc finger protein 414 [Mugil cephalus]
MRNSPVVVRSGASFIVVGAELNLSAAMKSPGTATSQTSENENEGNKRLLCPLHGCKRVYTDTGALESHIKDHDIPAQSLPGKVLLCSTIGCSGSFPNMQKLMEHTRHHHKPNIFFQCESCRTKLRSYRGLLTHLHTCAKVPRGKSKSAEQAPPQPAALPNLQMDQDHQQLEPVSAQQQMHSVIPIPDPGSIPATAAPQLDATPPTLQAAPIMPVPETAPHQLPYEQLAEVTSQPSVTYEVSNLPPPGNLDPKAAPEVPDAQGHHQTQNRSPESVCPAAGSAPRSPPGSPAIWKKSQGMACSRRILWEHTRGRYTCVQCGHVVTNRKDMTQHISSHHSSSKAAAEDTGSSATNT